MEHVIVELEADGALRLPQLRNGRIDCVEGALWITLRDNPKDITLERGASCRLSGTGIFIQAIRPSKVALEASAGDAQLGFARLSAA